MRLAEDWRSFPVKVKTFGDSVSVASGRTSDGGGAGGKTTDGGGGGGGSLGLSGVVILSLNDCDIPTLPSFVDPVEKDCRASFREGRDIRRILVVSWNMC